MVRNVLVDKEATAVGRSQKSKHGVTALNSSTAMRICHSQASFAKPSLFLFNFAFGDVKEWLAKCATFLFGLSKDIIRSKMLILGWYTIFKYTSGLNCV